MPAAVSKGTRRTHSRFADESESEHLADGDGGSDSAMMEVQSPPPISSSRRRLSNRARCCIRACKLCCMGSFLLIAGCLLWIISVDPNPNNWGQIAMRTDVAETFLYLTSSQHRKTVHATRSYYETQRPLVLESARRFQALNQWTMDMHLSTYKVDYYDLITVRTEMMLRRWLADPRNDDFLWEKDKCVMYSWFRRNGFPSSRILREYHDIRGSAEHVTDVIFDDMRNLSGPSAFGSHQVTYPLWMKCCHLTQGHAHSTHIVRAENNLDRASDSGVREWMESHWTARPDDHERTHRADSQSDENPLFALMLRVAAAFGGCQQHLLHVAFELQPEHVLSMYARSPSHHCSCARPPRARRPLGRGARSPGRDHPSRLFAAREPAFRCPVQGIRRLGAVRAVGVRTMFMVGHKMTHRFAVCSSLTSRAYYGYAAAEGRHFYLFRDNSTREYPVELFDEHAAVIHGPNEHWLFTEGHMEKIWRYAEGVALISGIEMIRIDFFLQRESGALILNENSLSSACKCVDKRSAPLTPDSRQLAHSLPRCWLRC